MSILSIIEVKPGMKLEQAVMSPENDTCLLSAGTILSIKNIEKLKDLKIEEVDIADRDTVFISPTDKMAESLVSDFIRILRKTSPKRPEANKNDEVVTVARILEAIIVKVAKNEEVLSFLVELKVIDNLRLYEHSIYTSVLSGLVAGCMKLNTEEIVCAVIGGLLHNIGVAEMPMLLNIEDFTPQQKICGRNIPPMVIILHYRKIFRGRSQIVYNITMNAGTAPDFQKDWLKKRFLYAPGS